MRTPSISEVAWFAGLFDGEGSTSIQHVTYKGKYPFQSYRLRLRITLTHLPTLERVKEIWAAGTITPHHGRERSGQKPAWIWNAVSNQAQFILQTSLPYLVTKKAKAEIAIAFQRHRASLKGIWGLRTPRIEMDKGRQFKALMETENLSPKVEHEIKRILDQMQRPLTGLEVIERKEAP